MVNFAYGPVELYLIGLSEQGLAPQALDALLSLQKREIVRVLDFVIVTKNDDGEVTFVEIDEDSIEYGVAGDELGAVGLAGDEDIQDLAQALPPGGSAAVVALEMLWAKELASTLAATGGEVLSFERVPAPVVNALIEAVDVELLAEAVEEAELEDELAEVEAALDEDESSSATDKA